MCSLYLSISLLSTLDDMHKFMVALGSEKLLSQQMWELAFTPHSFPSLKAPFAPLSFPSKSGINSSEVKV